MRRSHRDRTTHPERTRKTSRTQDGMFTNKDRPDEAANDRASAEAPGQRRQSPGRPRVTSIIASGVKVTGAIDAEGAEVQVDGEVEGVVRGGSLMIGDTGILNGDAIAESVTVHGSVEGSVRAHKVMLARNAQVRGDIVHESLSVEMGAVFEGQCRYQKDPLSQPGREAQASPQIGPKTQRTALG